ncbi:hypothetical protein Ocin01_12655 [Orchesella cincta]|uniref:Uncharacterized protein n=1 Tax=Orchesella cincta TaxID=48709 RepID=A0A1D2MMH3_ORCCI|nr:hypothetical protein Ocin01_12655 [Orchesella cincta]
MPGITGETKLKTFETGGKSSWPLPPSSVFKCRPATPFIEPILFYLDHNLSPLPCHTGVLVVGDMVPETEEQNIANIEEVEISNYLNLKGRRASVQSMEAMRDQGHEGKHVSWVVDTDEDETPKPTEHKDSKKKNIQRSTSQIVKFRKWSPFQKDRGQSWKLFY